jgi:regulator of protease activity HflC (stomatin/prohibitin superfamily)
MIDEQTEPWGIKVTAVEIKDVGIPSTMQRAMARQAEAERERRAKVIHAEGELQASSTLAEAAGVMARHPTSLQLRYLQTLREIGVDQSSTIVFPVPLDSLRSLLGGAERAAAAEPRTAPLVRRGNGAALPHGEPALPPMVMTVDRERSP